MAKTPNEIFREFEVDGVPSSGKHKPLKAEIRTFLNDLNSAINGAVIGNSVTYQTRGSLFADLSRPANSLGVVFADGNADYNGVYIKNGNAGTGSWTLTTLALPASFAEDLSEVVASQSQTSSEVFAARSGAPNLAARLNIILDAALDQSDNVLNYLSDIIEGQAIASQQRDDGLGVRIDSAQNEVTAARSGSTNLTERLSLILDTALDQSDAVQSFLTETINGNALASQQRDGELDDKIDLVQGEVAAARQGSPSLADRLTAILNWSNEQDQAQNEYFNERIDYVILSVASDLAQEVSNRNSAVAARTKFSDAAQENSRPGEVSKLFTATLDGSADQVTPPTFNIVSTQSNGNAAELVGAATLATIAAFRCEQARQYRIRFVLQRSLNTEDPSNDAVSIGVRWLNKDKGGISTYEFANLLDMQVSDGRLEYQFNISTNDDANIDAIPPLGALYFRPFIRTFGGGKTLVEVIEVTDLSLTVDWSPDVAEYRREISGLQQSLQFALDRITTLENLV